MIWFGPGGVKIGTGLLVASRSGGTSIGNTGDTGFIGCPLAVNGIGCVGHGCSPGRVVSVGTGISLIGCTG